MPGAKGGWITVRDAVKKKLPKEAPKPGKFRLAEAAETKPTPKQPAGGRSRRGSGETEGA